MTSAKRLGQLLQEQQEPFMLKVYLLERGYSKNIPDSPTKLPNSSNMSMKFLKSVSQRKKAIPSCSKTVRAVFNKLVVSIRNPADDVDQNVSALKTRKSSRETVDEDRISSDSTTSTVFNSCSESDADSPQNRQVDSDRKFQRRCMEDTKQQLSPISVLEDTPSSHNSPIYKDKRRVEKRKEEVSTVCNMGTTRKMTDETIFSVALCKLIEQSSMEKPIHNSFSSEYIKIKLALQETKQLLFDCVTEVIETYQWKKGKWKKGKQQNVKEILGAEEIGNLLHENVLAWSKQTTNGTNTTNLLTIDLLASFEEWGDLEQQRKDIVVVIGGCISEDLISEIVTDMVSSPASSPSQV